MKQKYGKTSEIVHAHGQQISNLPVIHSTNNLKQIHQFYRTLNISINSLKTLGKLDTAEILVRQTLDKLGPVKIDLIRTDSEWQGWKFERLLAELREYTIRNPENIDKADSRDISKKREHHHQIKGLQAKNKTERKLNCVYCGTENHRSSECDKVKSIKDISRKKRSSDEKEALLQLHWWKPFCICLPKS